MASTAVSQPKIPTKNPQLRPVGDKRPARTGARTRSCLSAVQVGGNTRMATRGDDRMVVEVAGGVTVYPARWEGDRWRATWYEGGVRRQCQAASEERLAARLEKVSARLAADAANMECSGAELIGYFLSPDRHPPGEQWSRKHAHTQGRRLHTSAAARRAADRRGLEPPPADAGAEADGRGAPAR
jgi:hypothetical protein